MKKKSKKKKLTDQEAKAILDQIYDIYGLILAECVIRIMYGKGLLQSFSDKWKKEGYVFDEELLKMIDKAWEERNKRR